MTRQRPMRDAGLAISLLTIVPTRARWPEDGRTQVAGWFSAVGLGLGLLGYGIMKAADEVPRLAHAQYVLAALVVLVWAIATRLLHWDGLADVADGYWGSDDAARRLDIMSDSHTGAFGATAITLTALLEVGAIASIAVAHETPMLVVPVLARLAATACAWLGTPARPGGLGASVIGRPTVLSLAITGVPLGAAFAMLWVGYGPAGVLLGCVGVALAFGVPHVLSLRFGGVTGDVMGASVLITEALLFAAFALVL